MLHSSHGGVSSMIARSRSSVWWPQMQEKINSKRVACRSCDVSAPSQQAAPASPLPSPEYPFDMICSDFFSYGGHKYLIIVDRFSNWISVYKTAQGGAETLVKLLRRHWPVMAAPSMSHLPLKSSSPSGVCVTSWPVPTTHTAIRGQNWAQR